jgi:hypothetical protein
LLQVHHVGDEDQVDGEEGDDGQVQPAPAACVGWRGSRVAG